MRRLIGWFSLLVAVMGAVWPGVAAANGAAGKPGLVRLIISPREGGWMAVQMAEFSNPGPGRMEKLEVPLPPAAGRIELAEGGNPEQTNPEEDQLVDRGGLGPGESRRIIFTYAMPPGQIDLSMRFLHGVDSLIVVVPEGVKVFSPHLEAAGSTQLGGSTFRRFELSAPLSAGKTLQLLAGDSVQQGGEKAGEGTGSTPAPPPGQEIGHAHGGSIPKVLLNFGFIATALALAVTGTKLAGRRLLAPPSVPSASTADRRQLVERIAALDLQFREERLSEAAYQAARSRLKDEFVTSALAGETST